MRGGVFCILSSIQPIAYAFKVTGNSQLTEILPTGYCPLCCQLSQMVSVLTDWSHIYPGTWKYPWVCPDSLVSRPREQGWGSSYSKCPQIWRRKFLLWELTLQRMTTKWSVLFMEESPLFSSSIWIKDSATKNLWKSSLKEWSSQKLYIFSPFYNTLCFEIIIT